MVVPSDKEIKRFYQSAQHRLKDAEYLLSGKHTTGAVYLAGYCIECFLKALILSMTPVSERRTILNLFRGSKTHNFVWLQAEYMKRRGASFPVEIQRALAFTTTWSVDLRYSPEVLTSHYASRFLKFTREFATFADGRL